MGSPSLFGRQRAVFYYIKFSLCAYHIFKLLFDIFNHRLCYIKEGMKLNNDYDELLKNTIIACELCERDFSHEELIEVIKTDNDLEKQICILKLKEVRSQQEADLLIHNLTNHHGIIREAIAIKVNEFMKDERYSGYFQTDSILRTVLDAVIDMNPNICRLIMEVLPFVADKLKFFNALYSRAVEVINDASTMNRRKTGYIYSKKVFKIFWYLEAVAELGYFESQNEPQIQELLEKAHKFDDYTIREKAAKIVFLIGEKYNLSTLKTALEQDENYFVRRFLTTAG